MNAILPILAAATLLAMMAAIGRARTALKGTTLTVAWLTLLASLGTIVAAWIVSMFDSVPEAWRELLWYLAAISLLIPPVAVLGARRPGAHAWTWFVLLPLGLVLLWPAINAWSEDGPPRGLLLEGPHILGFAVVLTMGAGNYFGTRHTLAAILYAIAAVALMLHFVEWTPLESTSARASATTLLALATYLTVRSRRATNQTAGPAMPLPDLTHWESVWRDFRDSFGIVWAKRVMDRMNEAAKEERWLVRLDLDGFVAVDPPPEEPLAADRLPIQVEHWMRFLMRRFVDSGWIDAPRHKV
ncbi:MAG: hypothetical protein IT428_19595 [Planctomycetaceae bacterium]|nr:hypothetical protein [Planctomycetaceae bacterium]